MSRILIIEVDPFVRSSLTRALEKRGHSVAATGCAHEALAEALARDVDLVMASRELGAEIDVDSLLESIELRRPQYTCVVMSNGIEPDAVGRSRHVLLEKPFSFDAVARIIGSLDTKHIA